MVHPDPDPRSRQARLLDRLSLELRNRQGKVREPRLRAALGGWSRGLGGLARLFDRYRAAEDGRSAGD